MSAYGWVIIGSFLGPFLLSFDKKVAFYKHWRSVFTSIFIVGFPFLLWDELFTQWSVWGFTEKYLFGVYLGSLPIEEILFFVIVPYNCIFIFEVLKAYFNNIIIKKFSKILYVVIVLISLINTTFYFNNVYTFYACLIASILGFIAFYKNSKWLEYFCLTYLVALIPFLVVNGILTGAITENPIVWYNENEIIGWRIFTIPYEDLFYNFDLMFLVTLVHQFLRDKSVSSQSS